MTVSVTHIATALHPSLFQCVHMTYVSVSISTVVVRRSFQSLSCTRTCLFSLVPGFVQIPTFTYSYSYIRPPPSILSLSPNLELSIVVRNRTADSPVPHFRLDTLSYCRYRPYGCGEESAEKAKSDARVEGSQEMGGIRVDTVQECRNDIIS